jgi:hypothetical protein
LAACATSDSDLQHASVVAGMGYTHTWEGPAFSKAAWKQLCAGTRAIISKAQERGISIVGAMGDEGTEVEIDGEAIAFNGVGDDGYESFVLTRLRDAKPMDPVVLKMLTSASVGFRQQVERSREISSCKTTFDVVPTRPYDAVVTAVLALATHLTSSPS